MRALTFTAAGRVEWSDVSDPELRDDGDAIVRPVAVARCDLDAPMAAVGIFPGPFTVGHEIAAEVVQVGGAVRDHVVGDQVLVSFQVSCGTCVACRQQRFAACHPHRARAGAAFGFGPDGGGHGGGLADLLLVPHADHLLVDAPRALDPVRASTLPDNVVDAYRTVGPPLREAPGADVLVMGGLAPSIGLYAVTLAQVLGARSVRYIDTDAERVELAAALGAEAERVGSWPRRVDRAAIVVDNTGDTDGLTAALRSTDDYGRCTTVAIHFTPTTPIPLLEMYTRGITFHASRADSRRFLPEVLELVEQGWDPGVVPITTVAWSQADAAWLQPATKLVAARDA